MNEGQTLRNLGDVTNNLFILVLHSAPYVTSRQYWADDGGGGRLYIPLRPLSAGKVYVNPILGFSMTAYRTPA